MGTNYYMITKNKDLAHKYFATECDYGGEYPEYLDQEYELHDMPDYYYEIHLNKLSYGWKPLFQVHKAFSTFKELEQFYLDHKDDLTFEDEYGRTYTFEQYKKKVVDHSNVEPEPVKWVYEEDPICGRPGHKYLRTRRCNPDEADLWTPFDHREYARTEEEARDFLAAYDAYVSDWHERYKRDPDYKFDWTEGEFV